MDRYIPTCTSTYRVHTTHHYSRWSQPLASYAFRPHHRLPISILLGRTTHVVPDISSSVCPFAFWQLSSPSYDLVPHHSGCLPFSMLLCCTSHAVPDIGSSLRPFAFRQLNHFPLLQVRSRTSLSRPAPALHVPGCVAFLPQPWPSLSMPYPPPMSLSLACG